MSLIAPVNSLKLGDWVEQGLPFYSGSVSYLKKIQPAVPEGGRLFVRIPDYRGVAVRILVNGKEAGVCAWEPYEIDITGFVSGRKEVTLTIEVIGHRRNSHGPLHLAEKEAVWFGPDQYATEGKEWQEEYQLVPCGLMIAPELIVRLSYSSTKKTVPVPKPQKGRCRPFWALDGHSMDTGQKRG